MVSPGWNYGTGFPEPWFQGVWTSSGTMEPGVEPGWYCGVLYL